MQDPLPVWVAVGGSPRVGRARRARSGLPLTVAIIGGEPGTLRSAGRALPRRRWADAGHEPGGEAVAINTHASSARRRAAADAAFARPYLEVMNRDRPRARLAAVGHGAVRGAALAARRLAVGIAEQVAEKILYEHELFGNHATSAR